MSEAEEHIPKEHLFALIWAHREDKPAEDGEAPDPELVRMFGDLSERFYKPLPLQDRLGPETSARLWEHAKTCNGCRCMVLEDGPDSRPPKTAAEIEAEKQKVVDDRRKRVMKFWTSLPIGIITFGGAFYTIQTIRQKEADAIKDQGDSMVDPNIKNQIDPLWYLFIMLVFVASWFLAESYTIAKDLWIDFTAWKKAVPVIGEAWAARGKPKIDPKRELDD